MRLLLETQVWVPCAIWITSCSGPRAPAVFVAERMVAAGAVPLPFTHEHALRSAALTRHHADPFDRLLVAQAQTDNLTLVTGDPQLSAYDVPTLWS